MPGYSWSRVTMATTHNATAEELKRDIEAQAPPAQKEEPPKGKLSFLDSYLSLWIIIACGAGLALGQSEAVLKALRATSIGTTNILVAIGLVLMIYPPLAKVSALPYSNHVLKVSRVSWGERAALVDIECSGGGRHSLAYTSPFLSPSSVAGAVGQDGRGAEGPPFAGAGHHAELGAGPAAHVRPLARLLPRLEPRLHGRTQPRKSPISS